jgi:ubiquinone/menaquinone biosynthesis C-methylase UbiE
MSQDIVPEEEKMDADTYKKDGLYYNYDLHPKDDAFLEYYFSLPPLHKFIDSLNKLPSPQKVLDLGSGIGMESNKLKSLLPGGEIVSLDISSAGTKSGKLNYGLEQVQADVNSPPFGDNQFDGILCKDVLVHVPDKNIFLNNVSKMLRPDSLFVLISAEDAYEGFKQYRWTAEELIKIASENNLELISQEYISTKADDWYGTIHKRVFLTFKKNNSSISI